ncbi:hypothetical protein MUG78_16705 [Gordonia alkaliphila]|uniref:hypothetical protein n=1 Tax=Gordonia alkaliphila TaxID=1053547 RepID=UPI001FF2DB0A|nr:hypothetical protein [Gordonia alkaliphila]MCK0441043.1 hypothetical protein [Gordonia alkaliphila]
MPAMTVTWTMDFDADTPLAAAHDALRTLHDTYAGNLESPNTFEVTTPEGKTYTVDLGYNDVTPNF